MSRRRGRIRPPTTVEICVSDVVSAIAAQVGGAHRVELCDNLAVGGTTPSAGAIALACRSLSIPVQVLIRPRAGDFVYSAIELAEMEHDIEVAKNRSAAGVVLGVLKPDATIDADRVAELIAVARPMTVTFHKAFDQVRDQFEALETLIALGVDRILTSGGRPTALEGVSTLAALVARAEGRVIIMAGGRLDADSLPRVIRQGHVGEVHLGSAVTGMSAGATHATPGDGSDAAWLRDLTRRAEEIVNLVRGLEKAESPR
jgi:copper homeostasis protein